MQGFSSLENFFSLVIFCALLFVAGIGLFFLGFQKLRLKRFIETTPTSKVRSLAMGRVEIYGEVVPAKKKVLKSPLTGKDCVYYFYTIEEYRKKSNNKSGWVLVDIWAESIPFFLKDETGNVLVDSNGARINIPDDFNQRYESADLLPEKIMAFLFSERSRPVQDYDKVPADVKAFLQCIRINYQVNLQESGNPLRFKERVIVPGDKLYILGYAGNNPHLEEGAAKDNVEGIMIQKGNIKDLYFISDKPEKEVLKKMKWSWIGWLAGGSLLMLVAIPLFMVSTNTF